MLGRKLFFGVSLFFYGLQAAALPVHIGIDWPAGTPASGVPQVHIRAIRVVGHADIAVPIETEAATNTAVLDLSEGVWRVQASAPGYWSGDAEVTMNGQVSLSVQLTMWPAASLHGEVLTGERESVPHALDIRLTANAGPASQQQSAPRESGPPRAELHCKIDNKVWSCLGPAGQFDLKLEAQGYAPHYFWGVNLKAAGSTDLGRTELRGGTSVFGRAVRKDGSNPRGPCRALLQPDIQRSGGPESDTDTAPARGKIVSVPLTPQGYFQMIGALPGRHVLDIQCASASGFRELRVQADGETRIDPPIQLEELALNFAVTPKLDAQGQPWQLTVDTTSPRYRRIADHVMASMDGSWIRRGLIAGNYRVTVTSSDGTTWLERDFDLDTRTGPLSLHVAAVNVAGRVLLSSEPVRAQLVFSNDAGGASVTLRSGDDGRFQGLLPVTSQTQGSSWTVDAHVTQPPVSQRLFGVSVPPAGGEGPAWLDLDLPLIAVHGSVVTREGKPLRGIQVTFDDSNGTRTTTGTDDAGNFEMSELPPGKYTAAADSPEGIADQVPFEVLQGKQTELKLVLNSYDRVPLYVVSSQGPIADATIQIWSAPGVPRAFGRTDRDGRFEMKLPPEIKQVGLTVGAPGYALKMSRLPISNEPDQAPKTNTITLEEASGRLVVNLRPPDHPLDSSTLLYLVHDGVYQDARTIAGWGTEQPGTSGEGPAEVEAIEPGVYALCVVADPAQLAGLGPGPLPSDRCSTGSLERGETLTLTPQ